MCMRNYGRTISKRCVRIWENTKNTYVTLLSLKAVLYPKFRLPMWSPIAVTIFSQSCPVDVTPHPNAAASEKDSPRIPAWCISLVRVATKSVSAVGFGKQALDLGYRLGLSVLFGNAPHVDTGPAEAPRGTRGGGLDEIKASNLRAEFRGFLSSSLFGGGDDGSGWEGMREATCAMPISDRSRTRVFFEINEDGLPKAI